MTIQEYRNSLIRCRDELVLQRAQELLKIGLDVTALTKLRLRTRGEDSTGSQFAPYSPQSVLERSDNGYQVTYVDFTQTGRMLASVQPAIESNTDTVTVVRVKARDSFEQKKLNDQARYGKPPRGNILTPNQSEINFVIKASEERVLNCLRKEGIVT